jgi:hypothetical protein
VPAWRCASRRLSGWCSGGLGSPPCRGGQAQPGEHDSEDLGGRDELVVVVDEDRWQAVVELWRALEEGDGALDWRRGAVC